MVKVIYIANVSLDGFIEDASGSFEWTAPDDEVFAFITDLVRSVGTYLYGRRLYETMAVWETDATLAAQSEPMADFAKVWQARAQLRPRRSGRHEAVGHHRSDRRRSEPRGACVQGRANR
jgi:dihydrofolate reductase